MEPISFVHAFPVKSFNSFQTVNECLVCNAIVRVYQSKIFFSDFCFKTFTVVFSNNNLSTVFFHITNFLLAYLTMLFEFLRMIQ
jgi:hypothetical protein